MVYARRILLFLVFCIILARATPLSTAEDARCITCRCEKSVCDTCSRCVWISDKGCMPDNDGDDKPDDADPDDDDDGVEDERDNCQFVANTGQADCDKDEVGDVCDPDRDGDGLLNEYDQYEMLCDEDGDGIPDGVSGPMKDAKDALTIIVGALAVLIMTVEGIKMVTAQSPKERDDAKKGMIYVVIGLLLFLIAENFVLYLLEGSVPTQGACVCGV